MWKPLLVPIAIGLAALLGTDHTPMPLDPSLPQEYEVLRKREGIYDAEITFVGQDGPPTTGWERFSITAEGYWATSDFQGVVQGVPMHTHGVLGYDPALGKYVSYYFDSSKTTAQMSLGTYDRDTQSLTLWNHTEDDQGKPLTNKSVTEFHGDGGYELKIYSVQAGSESLVLICRGTKRDS